MQVLLIQLFSIICLTLQAYEGTHISKHFGFDKFSVEFPLPAIASNIVANYTLYIMLSV